ncbi:MAG: 6-phosphogluconolactonase [Verrucomicrobia bacterium]|nr:6-phosphogluconolactonase [Verrucomicrobiota bacterium]MBI3868224.1 6-phosphogluconolactonase [Verrucomicrobiota bacterium]
MPRVDLIQFESDTALAAAAADQWLEHAREARRAGDRCRVALSGGRIAKVFFSAIAAAARRSNVDLDHVDFFWADERCVPPDHSESNFAAAREALLAPLKTQSERIHRIQGELPPAQAAAEANAELARVLASDASRPAVLDLVILGMGEDGHVASLFPEGPGDPSPNPAPYRAVVASKPPPHRVTLSYAMIASARSVWVLASGAGKSEALSRSLISTQTPLGKVRVSRAELRIFSDIS